MRICTNARTTIHSARQPRPSACRVATCVAVLLLFATAACGSSPTAGKHRSSQPSTTVALPTAPAIAVTFEDHEHTSEGPYHAHAVLIAAGPTHIRYALKSSGFAPMLFILDGHRLLVHNPEEYRPWSLYEAAKEHPYPFGAVSSLFEEPSSARFAKGCPSATVVGRKTILGRNVVGYHCAAQHFGDGRVNFAHVDWRDHRTGLLLQSGHLHATSIDDHPRITASTFSTQPPAGAKVAVYAAQKQPGGTLKQAPDFQLKRVAGTGGDGTIGLSDYPHRPLVLAFFVSDLTFDPTGESCHGCVRALLGLQGLTDGGTDPAVLAVQEGDPGKPGYPLIPKGLRLPVVGDSGFDLQHSLGLSGQVGFAFIGSDKKVLRLNNKAPTDQQLSDALRALR